MSSSLKLFDRLHEEIWRRHYSEQTEKSYIHWVKEFIQFHNMTYKLKISLFSFLQHDPIT